MGDKEITSNFGSAEQYIPLMRMEVQGLVTIVAGYINNVGMFEFAQQSQVPVKDFSMREFGRQLGRQIDQGLEAYGLIIKDSIPSFTDDELESIRDGIDSILENYE